MAKTVRISDELNALARMEGKLQNRSITQQIEHWIKLGITAATKGNVSELDVAKAMTRKLDALDVQSGKRSPEYFYFIPSSMVKRSKPVFPKKYRKS